MLSPPPEFNIIVSDNPILLKQGDKKDILVSIEGNTRIEAEAALYINEEESEAELFINGGEKDQIVNYVDFDFQLDNVTITSNNIVSSILHINVTNKEITGDKLLHVPIKANISFKSPEIKNKEIVYNNIKTVEISKEFELTLQIEKTPPLLDRILKYFNDLGDITKVLITIIGGGIVPLIIFIRRKIKKNETVIK